LQVSAELSLVARGVPLLLRHDRGVFILPRVPCHSHCLLPSYFSFIFEIDRDDGFEGFSGTADEDRQIRPVVPVLATIST
jgi:hypothetical protein